MATKDEKDSKHEPAKSTGVNTTDAAGVDSKTQPGAATGADMTRSSPNLTPEIDMPGHPAARTAGEERLPHVLHSHFDVNRQGKIYRIPAGAIVGDTDLTDEEFSLAVANGLVREATVAEVRAAERAAQAKEDEAKALEAKKAAIGTTPRAATDAPPKGAVLVTDTAADAVARDRARAARDVALGGGR
jgi:hypothetical protein